jgi:hypothetical protein
MGRSIAFVLAILLSATAVARAQSSPAPSRHAPAWIAVGAGSGFGVGLWAGLTTFDDSINSDRKVWTTAILSAAGGGLLAYLLTREKRSSVRQGATGALGAARCDRCVGCDRCAALSVHLAPLAPVAPVAPDLVYSARSPSSGETCEALAAGR